MTSHIFGASDSASCANFCLKRAAEDNKGDFRKDAVYAVKKDICVDDFIKSVKTADEAKSLVNEVTKWMRNSRDVLSVIPEEERATEPGLGSRRPLSRNTRSPVGCGKRCLPIQGYGA